MSKSTDSDGSGRRPNTHAVRLRELCAMIGVSRSTAYTLLRDDESFPRGFYPSARVRAWRVCDVLDWIEARSSQAAK